MPDTPNEGTPSAATQPTPDAAVNNTAATTPGTGTEPATQAQPDITQTPEFKAALASAMERKIPQLKRSIARELTGEKDGVPSVEELVRQLGEEKQARQGIEARETLRDYLSDPANKLTVKPTNMAAIVKLALPDLEFGEDGKPTNLQEAVNAVKTLAPDLFATSAGSINAGNGRTVTVPRDMNSLLRQAAGRG
jgi:hypothetical protein